MSPIAIVMMTVFILLIWGAWLASFVHLLRNPDEEVTPE